VEAGLLALAGSGGRLAAAGGPPLGAALMLALAATLGVEA
jgi:hypothetical protein